MRSSFFFPTSLFRLFTRPEGDQGTNARVKSPLATGFELVNFCFSHFGGYRTTRIGNVLANRAKIHLDDL